MAQRLEPFKQADPSKVVGNYFAARDSAKKSGRADEDERRKDIRFRGAQKQQENVFADRETRLANEGEDREYLNRRRGIESDKDIQDQLKTMITQIDTTANDEDYQEQISQIPDMIGNRMTALDFSPEDIRRTTGDMFRADMFSKDNVKRLQKSYGAGPEAARTSTAYADLKATLGRKPTAKELREYKAKEGTAGQMPADAKMVEYLTTNKIAPDRKTAFKMVQMSKSDPVKLVNDMVRAAEAAQKAQIIMPGDEGYKDRQTLIAESQQQVMEIRKAFMSPEGGAAPASQHVAGGADPMMARTPGLADQSGGGGQQLTPEIAAQILQEAGGDKNVARQIAQKKGFTF